LLWLSTAKHGYVTQSCLIEVANAILYKFKTGCQWSLFPVEALFSVKVLTYGAVYHHYREWSKGGKWKSVWIQLLDNYRTELDMSCATYWERRKSSRTSVPINEGTTPMIFWWTTNCMPKGIT